jgi:hypothetical protein
MSVSTDTATPTDTETPLDFGQPVFTTLKKDVAYGKATAEIRDNKVVIFKDGKSEAVVIDVEDATKLSDAGHFEGSVVPTVINLPANWAAVRALENKIYLDNEGKPRNTFEVLDELVTLFRPGMTVKATNRRNQRLLETDEDGNFTFNDSMLTNGVLDLTDEITSPSKRVFRTQEQKTWDNLSDYDPTVRDAVWKAYLAATGKAYYVPSK